MKKLFTLVLLCAISVTLLMTSGCKKDEIELESSWAVPDYVTSGTVVSGEDALTAFNEALTNYYAAENMTFVRSMDFKGGAVATQKTIDITKCSGTSMFYQVTKQGTGAGKVNYGKRFYYDGTSAYEISEDSETRFPSLGTEDWSGMEYAAYDASTTSVADKLVDMRNFTLYVITADSLADIQDNKVYSYNNKFYICLTIDCMGIALGGTQLAVETDIMGGLGSSAVAGTFEWVSDTKLYIELTEIDGEYYITARSLQENYKAKQLAFGIQVSVTCDQVISGTYSYEEAQAEITDEEKMNK